MSRLRVPPPFDLNAHAAAAALVALAAVYHTVLVSVPTNDNFMHLALARQVLGGEVPVRDFFDSGIPLMYLLSALAEQVVGYRLLSEALLVGGLSAVSAYLVYRCTWELTASRTAAVLAALLLVLAAPRGYSYPKLIVYAGAAALWWGYVRAPGTRRLVALGLWTALAFYWRPDHGVYVAVGVVLATVAAQGPTRLAATATATAGGVALILVLPFLVFVQVQMGLLAYVQTGYLQGQYEHVKERHAVPDWPLRGPGDLVRLAAAEAYAPAISIRWTAGSGAQDRAAVMARHGAVPLAADGPQTQRVRLSDISRETLRRLIDEPIVEDTADVDRGAAILLAGSWRRPWHRWQFAHAWLRVEPFPAVDGVAAAGETLAALWYVLPLAFALLALAPLRRHLVDGVTPAAIAAFAAFGLVVDVGLLRTPYAVRAVDAVVLPAVMLACVLVVAARAVAHRGAVVRASAAACVAVCAVLVLRSVAVAGDLDARSGWLAGEWASRDRARGAWADAWARLSASPPIAYWEDRPAGADLRLARYAHACVPESDRLLVLWFAPQIHYYADRLMAHRHVVFVPAWRDLAHEEPMTLAKIERHDPPIVLATRAVLEAEATESHPRVVEHVRTAYDVADAFEDDGQEYVVFARRGRPVLREYGPRGWPCYAAGR
jgi:hypothetical protein